MEILKVMQKIFSPNHCLNNHFGDIAVGAQVVVVLHLPALVEEPDVHFPGQLLLAADRVLDRLDRRRGLLLELQVAIRVLGRADDDFDLLVFELERQVPVLDLRGAEAERGVDAEDRHLVLVELGVHAHLHRAVQHVDSVLREEGECLGVCAYFHVLPLGLVTARLRTSQICGWPLVLVSK